MIPNGFTLAANRASVLTGETRRAMTIYPASRIAYLTAELVEGLGDPSHISLGYGAAGRVVVVTSERTERNARRLYPRGAGANVYVPTGMIRALAKTERPVNPIRIEFEGAENGIALGTVIAQGENEHE